MYKIVSQSRVDIIERPSYRRLFDMGGTTFRSGELDQNGIVSGNGLTSLKLNKGSTAISTPQELVDLIARQIIEHQQGSNQNQFVLSIAGPVAQDNRTLIRYTNVFSEKEINIPIAEMIEAEVARQNIRISFHLINDGLAGTLGEMSALGAAPSAKQAIGLIVGTGVGGQAVERDHEGKLSVLSGIREFGHQQIDPAGLANCGCGSKGCLEAYTSGPVAEHKTKSMARLRPDLYENSVLFEMSSGNESGLTNEVLGSAVQKDDAFALRILDMMTRPMATAIRNAWVVYPDLAFVFIGGFALGMGDHYILSLRKHLKEIEIPFFHDKKVSALETQLLLGKLDPNQTNVIGGRIFLSDLER